MYIISATTNMPRLATLLSLTIVAAFQLRLAAAGVASEDVPVPGGTAAMARSLGIDPVPDRARFVAEIARLTHQTPDGKNTTRARAAALLLRARAVAIDAETDSVPIPLSVAIWSRAVFHRAVAPADIVSTILGDPHASLLCYGLAGLDDETLEFLAEHSELVTRLYEHNAAAFAAFGSSLRVHQGRLALPGGAEAAALWESVVGERATRPDAFVRELFDRDEGRLAYLYDAIGGLDGPRTAFALGLWMKDPAARLARFQALAILNRAAIPQWQPMKLPFTRPLTDIASVLLRVQVEPDGSPSPPAAHAAWRWIFASEDVPPAAAHPRGSSADESPIDAAWLAQMIVPSDTRDRGDRLDQLAFGQRVFGHGPGVPDAETLTAIRGFPRFRMLMLTLERIGVTRASLYANAVHRARQLSDLDRRRLFIALGQFQGAVALVARMTAVRTLDAVTAESLIASLIDVPLVDGRYGSAIATWMRQQLRPALTNRLAFEVATDPGRATAGTALAASRFEGVENPAAQDFEDLMLDAVSGARRHRWVAGDLVRWEGHDYHLDIGASEGRRLRRIREKQGGSTLDEALAKGTDEAVAEALMAWTYAVSIAGPDSAVLLTGSATKRHDFGFGPGDRGLRLRVAWALPRQEIAVGVPWHVTGALLGLDVALAGLSLRRVGGDRAIDAPTLSSNERDAFATSVALLNPFDLQDRDRDAIAVAVGRGRLRVSALDEGAERMDEIAAEINMDGWRRRALRWTLGHEPQRVGSMFSMTELLVLGRAALADLQAWGMSGLVSTGCFCTRLAPPNRWRFFVGRPQLGLMAPAIADLNLHVAVMLRELRLPAAVAKSVLSAAVQDFVDEARPTDFNDWLTLVRTAQGIPRERIEDYVAVATADGPLVPRDVAGEIRQP